MTLGIPGNAVSAVFLGGLVIHGMRPGPQLFTRYGAVTYSLFIGLIVATLIMCVVGLAAAKYFARISTVPTNILGPIIMTLCVIGAFAVNNNVFNIYIMFVFGIIGFAMQELDYFPASFILGLVLGPIAESEFRRSLLLSKGNYGIFLSSPICIGLAITILFFVFYPYISGFFAKEKNK